jgi:hypothetical protein
MENGGIAARILNLRTRVGGEWSTLRPGRFIPGEETPVPIGWKAGWTPQHVWTR